MTLRESKLTRRLEYFSSALNNFVSKVHLVAISSGSFRQGRPRTRGREVRGRGLELESRAVVLGQGHLEQGFRVAHELVDVPGKLEIP